MQSQKEHLSLASLFTKPLNNIVTGGCIEVSATSLPLFSEQAGQHKVSLIKVDDSSDAFTLMHQLKSFIDIVQSHGVGNKVIQLKLTF